MKITQVISDSNVGGAGVLLSSVTCGLMKDFDFEIIIPQGSLLYERLPRGVRITELPFSPDKSFDPKDIKTFFKYFKREGTDVLHTHASLSARLGGRLAGVGVCLSTRHCAKPDAKVKRMTISQRMVYNYCTDVTVSTADFATKNLIKEGLAPQKIVTIKNGSAVPITITEKERETLLRGLGLEKDVKIIGSCARLEEVKGQDIILRAAPKILSAFPNVRFLFLGSGSKMEKYKRLGASLGIEKRIVFLGYVSDPAAYQNLFYINVNASRGTETSCLATSECMALGVPTVASDFGGNTEMIKDGVNGILFPCDNVFALERAICRLLSDGELYEKLSSGALSEFRANYSRDLMASRYKELYMSLLAQNKKRSLSEKWRDSKKADTLGE